MSPPRSKSPAKAPKSPSKSLPAPAATPDPAPQPARVVPEMPPLNLQYRSSPERPPAAAAAAAAYVPYDPKPKPYELPKHELPKYPSDFAHHKTDSSALAHHKAPHNDLDELSKKLEALGAVPHHNPTPSGSSSYGGATSAGQTGQYQYQAPAFTGSYGQTQVQSSYQYPAQTQNTGFAHRYPELARHL